MNEWQPIETAPKDGTTVLLFSPGYGRWLGSHTGKPVWYCSKIGDRDIPPPKSEISKPTHWMPLPEPPK